MFVCRVLLLYFIVSSVCWVGKAIISSVISFDLPASHCVHTAGSVVGIEMEAVCIVLDFVLFYLVIGPVCMILIDVVVLCLFDPFSLSILVRILFQMWKYW